MTYDADDLFQRLTRALGAQYRVERELGRGGMGVVFQGTDVALDRPVAIKVIHPELAGHETLARRFLSEARTIARLRHPNIVTVHAAGTGEGLLFYVMDEVPGETLRARLARERRLPPAEAARIASDIAAALDAASQAGVVHRDVKPENVLLDSGSGRAMLADFGIARVLQQADTSERTASGVAVGTPAYMSPEQAAGEEVDSRSDLYSLGVVTFEMLAGSPPFEGPNRVVVSRHIAEPAPSVRKLRPDTPEPLAAAIAHALEKNPSQRWQSGEDFRRAIAGEIAPPRRRKVRQLALIGGLGAVLLAALGVTLSGRANEPPEGVNPRHSLLVLPFDNLRNDSSVAWLGSGSVSILTMSLAQWNDLQLVDADRVHDLLEQHDIAEGEAIGRDEAREIARDAGVWTVALGRFERVGDSLRVVATLYDVASGAALETAEASGAALADPRQLYDELAFRLLDLAGAPAQARTALAQATTSSLQAYRAYLQGVEALNHWDLTSAELALREATRTDSTFGLAYYKLALTRGWMVGPTDSVSDHAMARAVAFSTRLPLHDRKVIAAYRAFLEGDFSSARNLYQELIARDSSDVDAWYGLGEAWFHDDTGLESMPKSMTEALRSFRRTLALDPDYVLAYEHIEQMLNGAAREGASMALLPNDSFALARTATRANDAAGRVRNADRARTTAVNLAQSWVATQPTAPRAHGALVDALVGSRNFEGAMSEIERYRAVTTEHPETPFIEAQVHFAAGRVEQAAELLRAALDSTGPEDFRPLASTPAVFGDVASAANVFAYQGDLATAARSIELAERVRSSVYPYISDMAGGGENWSRTALGELYAATGAPGSAMRRVWQSAAEAAREAPEQRREPFLNSGAAAAIGLFTGLAMDTSAVTELATLTSQPLPPEVRALLALSGPEVTRADSATARKALAESDSAQGMMQKYVVYRRPLAAQAWAALGEYRTALALLEGYEPELLRTGSFDPRWAMLGRVRLLRAELLQRLGRTSEARTEYERVLEQWKYADESLQSYVRFAREGLAGLSGARG